MIIGITGGTGCGKTTLLNLIRERGGLVLDCDAIYHELLRTDIISCGFKVFCQGFSAGIYLFSVYFCHAYTSKMRKQKRSY